MSMIATNLRQFFCCAARWAQIIQQRGFFQLGTRSLYSDGFEEDDESKTIEEDSILKDLTSSGIGKGRASQRVSE
jgi:hypothetical protein